ncbi:hypothetical protein [Tenacibaculum haliotis]|uniref:hypothetical protein n=1 Tax=Tenacibaculum haliotis TaxID=1888914 RepID=UPI0021AF9F48|nr:hypothetical protein [Tenacibaculum haliotis]MCT4699018.1 hypothetical protein [Tenacibaculum haliotis]
MNNKIITLIALLLFSATTIFSQKDEFNLIALDSTWGQEVIRFPARHMDYIGVGEVRFPPKRGWIKPKHDFFWSYTYAWSIDVNRKIPAKELEMDLVKYFNSLNKIDMNAKADEKYSSAVISKIKKQKSVTYYKGSVKIFDRFATKKMITLNVLIENFHCKKNEKTILLFKFSPKDLTHKTWATLNDIKLLSDLCN